MALGRLLRVAALGVALLLAVGGLLPLRLTVTELGPVAVRLSVARMGVALGGRRLGRAAGAENTDKCILDGIENFLNYIIHNY